MRHHVSMEHRLPVLLGRLDAIAASLARSRYALALIGLGSAGTALDRLDAYSDLDFFAIVEHGHKNAFIEDLTWLEEVAPIAFSFKNTRDGCKVLFEDGIYAEFAVFDREELATMPLEGGRIVWQREGADLAGTEMRVPSPPEPDTAERLLGEILTNLYVGLMRLRRGERLSAQHFIQGYAVDRILQICPLIEPPVLVSGDRFDGSRRFEQRFPHTAQHLPLFVQGYNCSAESAVAILAFVERHFQVNAAIAQRIRELAHAIAAGE